MKHFQNFLVLISLLFVSHTLQAHPGVGIVMDSKGNVFYTDLVHVWKISAKGEVSIAVKDVHTHQLVIDEHDNLYGEHVWYEGEATDSWSYYVWCLDYNGDLEYVVPPTRGFPENNTLVRDQAGNSYFAHKSGDHEILKRQLDNGQIESFSSHRFSDIRWLFHDPLVDRLLVIDNLTLKTVGRDGSVKILSDKLHDSGKNHEDIDDRHYLMGAWSDSHENIYVAAFGARKVKRINPGGDVETIYKSPIGWSPCGGLVAPDGSLWIMEFSVLNKARVRKINPGGKDDIYKGK